MALRGGLSATGRCGPWSDHSSHSRDSRSTGRVALQVAKEGCRRAPPRLVVVAQAVKSKGRGGKAGGTRKQGFSSGSGFGSKEASPKDQSVDALTLLRRSEQLYQRLLLAAGAAAAAQPQGGAQEQEGGEPREPEAVLREYVICCRAAAPEPQGSGSSQQQYSGGQGGGATDGGGPLLPDWLPVAELVLLSSGDASDDLPRALPFVCRELAECAGLKLGASFPRHVLEYAYESAESFYDEVLSSALGFGDVGEGSSGAADSCPYSVLGLQRGAPLSQVRAAYRGLAAQHHPDRHEEERKATAEQEFRAVSDAYERIKTSAGSLIQGSLAGSFAALGGPKRQGLSPPLKVRPSKGEDILPATIQLAVRPLEGEVVEVFLARIMRRVKDLQTV